MSELWWDGTGVTPEALKAEVERLGEEFPDKVAACIYTHSGFDYDLDEERPTKPGCIVGQAVYNITGKYVPYNFESATIKAEHWREALGEPRLAEYAKATRENSSEAFVFVLAVQAHQDCGGTWGDGLEVARNH